MNSSTLFRMSGMPPVAWIAVFFILIGASDLRAQRFEALMGNATVGSGPEGIFGVQPVTGGYVTAGRVLNTSGGVTKADVYIAKFDPNGVIIWSNSYSLRTNLRAEPHGLTVCANGDIVVVGRAVDINPLLGSGDIFMLRVTSAGAVATNCSGASEAYLYGNAHPWNEDAWSVIEAQNGQFGSQPGDLVICGKAVYPGTATTDAYILRVSPCGAIRWDNIYRSDRGDEELYSLTEAKIGASGVRGDIIAAGYSRGFGPGGGMIMRVDGNSGVIGPSPEGIHVMMDTVNYTLYSVKELQTAPNAGQIVAAGTRFFGGVQSQIIVRKTTADPCVTLATAYYHNFGSSINEAYDIQEILLPGTGTLNVGNLVLTGATDIVNPMADAYLLEITAGGLGVVPPPFGAGFTVYGLGGGGNAWGRSLRPVYGNGLGLPTDGFIISGARVGLLGTSTLYVIKTDAAGWSACSNVYGILTDYPDIPQLCWDLDIEHIDPRPKLAPTTLTKTGYTILCFTPKEAMPGASIAEESAVETFPNPVTGGAALDLVVVMEEAGEADLVVADPAGREVSRRSEHLSLGENRFSLSTEGWAAGTYLVSVTANGHTWTRKVVVIRN